MRILLNRTIPLSRECADAWRVNGCRFAKRGSSDERLRRLARYYDAVINLGVTTVEEVGDIPLFNAASSTRATCTPGALRRTMSEFLPPIPQIGEAYWYKKPGFGGRGKTFYERLENNVLLPPNHDIQKHIEGEEYRVNTVGDSIVQAQRKHRVDGDFLYEWVGVQGIRTLGIIPLIKQAVRLVPKWEWTVYGWDVIKSFDDGKVYVLEVNSCPGVSDYTARRILNVIERRLTDG